MYDTAHTAVIAAADIPLDQRGVDFVFSTILPARGELGVSRDRTTM